MFITSIVSVIIFICIGVVLMLNSATGQKKGNYREIKQMPVKNKENF